MADEFINDVLKKVVAQICQLVGFDGIMTTPLLVLSDILKRFISDLGRKSQQYSEHCGRTTQTLKDLDLAFRDFQICPRELCEFLTCIAPLPEMLAVPKFPVEKRQFDIQENTLLFPTNLEDNTSAIEINPLPVIDNITEPSVPKLSETVKATQPLGEIVPIEPLKIKIPREPLKIKISLQKINYSSNKKGIEKSKKKKKKKAKSKK